MSHLSIKPAPSIRLVVSTRLAIVLGLSLALWLGLGWGLVTASRLPGSTNGVTSDAGGEVSYDFALQGTCDITVTNAADSGAGSLRQAIANACDGGRITFAGNYTIYLNSTLSIYKRLTIDGGTRAITVSGDSGGDGTPDVQVFYIESSGVVTLTHLSIVSGSVRSFSGFGGGIYNAGTLTVQNCTLSGNWADAVGGGIYNAGTLTVQNSNVSGNWTEYYASEGGGICNAGTLIVQNSTFSGNSAYYGGGILNAQGTMTVQNSTLSGNWADAVGGGIYNSEGTLTVQNSTFSGNSAEYGGGIYNGGTLNLHNTLIANSPSGGDCQGSVATNDHNLIADGSCSPAISGTPHLGPLANYGGSTLMYALLPGSPAIDAGVACLATDQRGVARPQGAACDIGAFESRGFGLALAGGDAQSTLVNTVFAQPLSVILSSAYGEPIGSGGVISFTAPSAGASLNPAVLMATTSAGGAASVMATANGVAGSYAVTATATGVVTPVTFHLTNTVPPAPAMTVLGNGQAILDGDTTPSTADGTDFGSLVVGQAITRTFIISNGGTAALTLTGSPRVSIGGPAALDFSLGASPGTPVAPNATTTFQVRFTPSVAGTRVATVTIANNDPLRNPYDFAIQGTACGSAITVTNAYDSGSGSLRQAIADACDSGRITFAADYTIYLTTTLEITRRLTIDGEAHAIAVSGDSGSNGSPNVRVFYIQSSGVATLTHLSIVSGTTNDGSEDCPGDCGGGISNFGTLTVQSSTMSGNEAYYGGGIYNQGTLAVRNSTLSGNSAGWWGGGIYNADDATLIVQNSTLSGNSSGDDGGGIYSDGTLLNLSHTIVANNPSGGDCRAQNGVITSDHNLIGSTGYSVCGLTNGVNGNIVGVSPLLGPLAGNGGRTRTHALLAGSPAIDAGAACPATDQRGIARPQGAACDIGAFESQGFNLTLTGGDSQSVPINVPFAQPLSVTLSSVHGEPVGPGGVVTFIAPVAGASLAPAVLTATTNAGGAAGVTATANGLDGSYAVTATATGVMTPVTFALTNTSAPAMAVLGNGQVIADGDTVPSAADGTDFGSLAVGQAVTRTFAISNSGTANLTLTGSPAVSITGPAAPDFSLVASPGTPVAPHTMTTFQVRFTPPVAGTRVATLTIASDDPLKDPYAFAIRGTACGALTVTNADDSGPGSLRQAIADACDGERITFAGDYTIYLTATLEITKRLTIDGAAHAIAVRGDSAGDGVPTVRVFYVGSSGVATLTHLSIISGTAGAYDPGGGIYNAGTLAVQNSALSGNWADDGGGIANYGTLTMQNSALSDNSAAVNGGGIYNRGALTMQNSILSGNWAYIGCGIDSWDVLTVTNSTLSGNWGSASGGINNHYGIVVVQNSTISGNSVTFGAGGIYNDRGTLVVQNSTLSGNSAEVGNGGGIENGGTLTVTNSTLFGNSAYEGGGIANYSDAMNLYNTLIASSPRGGDCRTEKNIAANDHNLIADGSCSPALSGDPRLGPLADYGGPSAGSGQAILTFALLPGSPALDSGAACLATDQRGVARPQGAACDIGAFESRGFSLALAGGNNQSTPVNAPFAQPLRVTVSSAYGEPVGPGGVITFTAPGAGASLAPAVLTATTGAGGAAGVTATANGLVGSYGVTATARGVSAPVTFHLTNTPPAPAMAVLGNGQVIPDGDAAPSTADGTDFGSLSLGQAVTRAFTISNGGTADLTLTGASRVSIGGSAALDFSLVASPAITVAPGATTTFQVRFTPSLTGTRVATVTIANDDPLRNPYDFAIQGTASDASNERHIFLPVILRGAQ